MLERSTIPPIRIFRYFRTRKKKRVKFAITVYQMVYHICALSVVITFVKLWLPPSYDAAGFSRDR